MNFKVGDRIKLKSEEQLNKELGKYWKKELPLFTSDMSYLFNGTHTILRINGAFIEIKGDERIRMTWNLDKRWVINMNNLPKNFIGEKIRSNI